MFTRESDLCKESCCTTPVLWTAKPTRFDLDLISIKDDLLQPDITPPVDDVSDENVSFIRARNAFWNAVIRPYLWSPMMIGDTKALSGNTLGSPSSTDHYLDIFP